MQNKKYKPSTSLGKSAGFLGSTATRTTGDTLNFITLMLWASLKVEMVPVLTKNWSTPTNPQMLPKSDPNNSQNSNKI